MAENGARWGGPVVQQWQKRRGKCGSGGRRHTGVTHENGGQVTMELDCFRKGPVNEPGCAIGNNRACRPGISLSKVPRARFDFREVPVSEDDLAPLQRIEAAEPIRPLNPAQANARLVKKSTRAFPPMDRIRQARQFNAELT